MARALRIVLVRKRGTRKDGRNYVATCTICSGAKADLNLSGVDKEWAQYLAAQHCDTAHGGRRTFTV